MITYSSGNHAQGVARAARLLGAPAVVVMPSDAPAIKRERVEADGAEIVVVGTASDERQQVAEEIAAERGLAIIPPFDDDRIIAGQGTIGLELVEDLPDISAGPRARSAAAGWRAGSPPRSGRCGRARASSASSPSWPPTRATRWPRGEIVRWPAELRVADDRRRDADAGARATDVRAPARATSTRS